MAGFFEDRWNGMKNGFGMMYEGGARLIKQSFGWQDIPESSKGLIGWIIESGRSAIDGLFDKNKGLLRLDQGYTLNPLEKESTWNILRHVRRGVSAVLNTANTVTTKFIGILSPSIGNFWSRMIQGAGSLILAPVLGDISPYLGPAEPTAHNDGSYQAANSAYYGQKAANDANYSDKASEAAPTLSSEPEKVVSAPPSVEPAKSDEENQKVTTTTVESSSGSPDSPTTKVEVKEVTNESKKVA